MTAFTSLIVAGFLGVLMRLAFVIELPEWIQYRNLMHTHSHLAMMGWIFGGLYLLIVHLFDLNRLIYRNLFWLFQVSIIGMLFSFPIQGYGLISIFFTTIHLLLSYVFVYHLFKDLNEPQDNLLATHSHKFLKTAALFLVISTLGTWALGVIMNTGLKGSALYYASIQFFLHFQFNGWFVFAILAILGKYVSLNIQISDAKNLKKAYSYLFLSCLLTYALSLTWSTPESYIFWINSIGVILQAIALYFLIRSFVTIWNKFKHGVNRYISFLLKFAFSGLVLKILIQTAVAIPYLAKISYTIKNFVIGFIHLLMLGTITVFLIAIYEMTSRQLIGKSKIGLNIFLIGFLLSEGLLFLQGYMLWMEWGFLPYYYQAILIISCLMPIGLLTYGVMSFSRGPELK
jgi:hypothetical protein